MLTMHTVLTSSMTKAMTIGLIDVIFHLEQCLCCFCFNTNVVAT